MPALWIPHWIEKRHLIETWFSTQFEQHCPPLYASVDIRHNSTKAAVIDTNLFSAGFNNLDEEAQTRAIRSFGNAWDQRNINHRRILLIPERHTRNTFYHANLAILKKLLEHTGSEVKIGYWHDPHQPELDSAFEELGWSAISNENQTLKIGSWTADLILLNNDLSSGIPPILQDIHTPILPPTELGWHSRLKSIHFSLYKEITTQFSEALEIDAWYLDTLFSVCDAIDFEEIQSLEKLQDCCSTLLAQLKREYIEKNIPYKPYLVIKPDAGTYGMGVMTLHDASELDYLNRKQKNKMSIIKDGIPVHRVLIQEGLYSAEQWNNHTAESVLYMVNHDVVGKFLRIHPERNNEASLNVPGMICQPVPLDIYSDITYLHTVVARLALLAAAREAELLRCSQLPQPLDQPPHPCYSC